jgi:hypothetical protein
MRPNLDQHFLAVREETTQLTRIQIDPAMTAPSYSARPSLNRSFMADDAISLAEATRPATEAAFCSARRVTFVGSRMPISSLSPQAPVPAL